MPNKHIAEMLIETNKKISLLIDKIQINDVKKDVIIDEVNEMIRELDKIVESMESKHA